MKITYLVQQFPPEVGAGPARVLELSERWATAGADVTVLTAIPSRMVPGQRAGETAHAYRKKLFVRESWGPLRVMRSWCYSAPGGGFVRTVTNNVSFMITSAMYGALRMPRTDVLIASSPPFFPHISGALLAKLKRVPLVLEIRDLWPDYLVGMGVVRRESIAAKTLFAIERRLLHAAEAVVVVTDSFAQRVAERGVDPSRILVVPNGVDLQQYAPADVDPQADSSNDFTIGYLGNFGAGQDLSVVVRAAALLQDEGVKLVLVGDGPDRRRVEQTIKSTGAQNVTLLDSIPKHQTRARYLSFDVCVVPLAAVPEFQETIPSKIFEIMACARPVLAAAGGETERLVNAADCGIAVPPGDPEGIASAVRSLRQRTRQERHEMGMRGRAHVARYYSRDMLAQRYLERLRDVISGKASAIRRAAAAAV